MRIMLSLFLFAWLPLSQAAIIAVSNTGQTASTIYPGNINENTWRGDNFTAGEDWQLSSIDLLLGDRISDGGNFFVQLWSDGIGAPGVPLLTLSGDANPNAAGIYTYTGSYALTLGTSYYVIAGVTTGNGAYDWTLSGAGPALDAASRPGWEIPSDGNAVLTATSGNWDEGGSFPFRFAVYGDVAAAPVPGTALILAPALALLGWTRRRRIPG